MYLKNSKIIVIKIGSALIVDSNKKIRKKWLSSFAKDIQKLKDKNQKIKTYEKFELALKSNEILISDFRDKFRKWWI